MVELEGGHAASCLMFPRLEGVDIYTFSGISQPQSSESSSEDSDNEFQDRKSGYCKAIPEITNIPLNGDAKLILWFSNNPGNSECENLGIRIAKHYKDVVFAGGYVESFSDIADGYVCHLQYHHHSFLFQLLSV